jgi:tRNA threonylcarbamoyladenosine biosynthesis protein TsaB
VTLTVALDTATDVASIAVGRGRQLMVEVSLPGRRHAAALLPGVVGALQMTGASLGDVTRVLCSDGPGSFTGLRIGFATVQGIVRGNEAVTVGTLPSLLASAWAAASWAGARRVAAVYDALRGEVFGAVYEIGAEGVAEVVAPSLLPLDELVRRTPAPPDIVVGDAGILAGDLAARWTGRPAASGALVGPRAAALLALDGVPGGIREVPDVFAFEPDYGRPAEAQTRWERSHGRAMPDSGGEYR